RDLVARQHDECVERPPRDPQRHVREARGIDHPTRKAVEQPWLAALGLVVTGGGVFLRDKEIVDPVTVAAGAAQPYDLPIVDYLGAGLGKQHSANELSAVHVEAGCAVRLEDR